MKKQGAPPVVSDINVTPMVGRNVSSVNYLYGHHPDVDEG